ncbi:hypothetical protein EV126DRAFT_413285 [Verticillium dahliae]|nr:hypothetical protein EV126DRAFT_413285 [Verticillium dahliae]
MLQRNFSILLVVMAKAWKVASTNLFHNLSSMTSTQPQWIIQSLRRRCNTDDVECKFEFSINTQVGAPIDCTYTTTAGHGLPASQSSGDHQMCGQFTIASGWSDMKPMGRFRVLAIMDPVDRMLIWATYMDEQVQLGAIVIPDQAYAPVRIGGWDICPV